VPYYESIARLSTFFLLFNITQQRENKKTRTKMKSEADFGKKWKHKKEMPSQIDGTSVF